jgi:hypothetical protein
MGNSFTLPSISSSSSTIYKTINFEDVQSVIQGQNNNSLLINTLAATNQQCLIAGTIPIENETQIINDQLQKNSIGKEIRMVIYGMNSTDESVIRKYDQLRSLGFTNVFLYLGGLFEWLLLQDIYSAQLFPTTVRTTDLLKYKGRPQFNTRLLQYK